MKQVLFLLVLSISIFSKGQNAAHDVIYDPQADASEQLKRAIEISATENKQVLVQVGGNWCPWCIKLTGFIKDHPSLDSIVAADYVAIKVNYSKENKNPEAMNRLGFPQRFGFPVFVILDGSGQRIHTQNTAYLEEGEGYNEEKIREFLLGWNRAAISADTYIK